MSQPFIFIGTYGVRPGKAEEYKKDIDALVKHVEANEPRLIAFNVYLSDDGRRTSIVQVHPDAESMEFHMQVVAEHIAGAFELLEPNGRQQAFGVATDELRHTLEQYATPDAPLIALPVPAGGFTRGAAGD